MASSGPAVSQPLFLHRQCCGADKGTVWNQIAQPQIRLCLSLAVWFGVSFCISLCLSFSSSVKRRINRNYFIRFVWGYVESVYEAFGTVCGSEKTLNYCQLLYSPLKLPRETIFHSLPLRRFECHIYVPFKHLHFLSLLLFQFHFLNLIFIL